MQEMNKPRMLRTDLTNDSPEFENLINPAARWTSLGRMTEPMSHSSKKKNILSFNETVEVVNFKFCRPRRKN